MPQQTYTSSPTSATPRPLPANCASELLFRPWKTEPRSKMARNTVHVHRASQRWKANAYIPIGKYTGPSAPPFSLETWERVIATSQPPPGLLETIHDNTSEDCLFLDVHVSRRALEKRGLSTTKREGTGKKGAPVVVAPVGH
ncbi:N-glycosylation protein-domain-containing protein [Apiospora arundinis]